MNQNQENIFDNVSPINNEVICSVPRSDAKDVDAALDAAHAAFLLGELHQ